MIQNFQTEIIPSVLPGKESDPAGRRSDKIDTMLLRGFSF